MKSTWINRKNNESCILFFNGWGMDENCIKHIYPGNNDILMLHDYSQTEIHLKLGEYKTVYVIAWSLGVYSAASFLKTHQIIPAKSIAINGTLIPIDEKYGIAPDVFDATVNNWNVINRTRFNMRMFGGKGEYQQMTEFWPKRSMENQYEELVYFSDMIQKKPALELAYDVVLIGQQDLIFTTENQLNYWDEKTRIQKMEVPHFPFKKFTNWQEIIEM